MVSSRTVMHMHALLIVLGLLGPALRPASAATGVTTRYWDCCKPSCAWPGKAATQQAQPFVRTCTKANKALSDAFKNEHSGCSGGGAWGCASQSPWAVSNTLAYGFAAAKLKGQGERDWCCACYQLDFTSGSVKGKRMIVQVINTGGDLGDNHFDIAIPGGGMGSFKGCRKQYPSTPASAWGRVYGGVSSKAACSKLPGALQAGCKFRFNWGGKDTDAAFDNPKVNWKRVKCPGALLSKSDCKRKDE